MLVAVTNEMIENAPELECSYDTVQSMAVGYETQSPSEAVIKENLDHNQKNLTSHTRDEFLNVLAAEMVSYKKFNIDSVMVMILGSLNAEERKELLPFTEKLIENPMKKSDAK